MKKLTCTCIQVHRNHYISSFLQACLHEPLVAKFGTFLQCTFKKWCHLLTKQSAGMSHLSNRFGKLYSCLFYLAKNMKLKKKLITCQLWVADELIFVAGWTKQERPLHMDHEAVALILVFAFLALLKPEKNLNIKTQIDLLLKVHHMQCLQTVLTITQYYSRDPRPPIPPHVMALSAVGLNLGVSGFLLTTHAKTNTKQ